MSIITVSRGTFSGGQALAEQLAQRLGSRCISRELLLETAARTYGYSAEKLASEMDNAPSLWDRLSGARTRHHIYVRAVLLEFARQGPMVYHGYVGHLHLADLPHVLRVRAIADLEYRVHAVMEERRLARNDALSYIKKADKERRDWVRFLFGVEWDDPTLYDLVVNLGRMGLNDACDVVVQATEMEGFKQTAESSKILDDLALASRISASLVADTRTTEGNVAVTADSGTVTLSGDLTWPGMEEDVLTVVREIEGVKLIRNELTLTPPAYYQQGM